jgi:translation initiation factor IF-2
MSKTRIYEIAKELGLENKAVLDLCEQLGITGKQSHSNSLSDDEADRLRRSVLRHAVSEKTRVEKGTDGDGVLVTERRVGTVIRRRRNQLEEQDQAATKASIDLSSPIVKRDSDSGEFDFQKQKELRDSALREADALFKNEETESKTEDQSIINIQPVGEDIPVIEEELSSSENVTTNVEVVQKEQLPEISASDARISEIRKRHDIRAPKILGKIELPVEIEPKAKSKEAAALEEEAKASKGKKKKFEVVDDGPESDLARKRRKRKQVLKKDDLVDYGDEREQWRGRKDRKSGKKRNEQDLLEDGALANAEPVKRVVKIAGEISVGELAKGMGVKIGDVITKLMEFGIMATINHVLDFDTATIIANEYEVPTVNTGVDVEEFVKTLYEPDDPSKLQLRPPVVTVMGHVDHGKTSLLDKIRSTSVTKTEAGGITQHIGAYNVKTKSGGSVTFLDTPGHEAFTAMRGRGAQVTDIVVLVVAADDGFMPQTIEAINHAQAAKVPIIVAINKIDKEGANLDRIKNQMAEHQLIPEEWGGDTIVVPLSAKTGEGIDTLLENLYAQTEILELKANPERNCIGTLIEARVDRGRGTVITVLVKNGTLKKGQFFVSGHIYGKVKALVAYDGTFLETVGPGYPVEVLGAAAPPKSGDDFIVFDSESQAKSLADDRAMRLRNKELAARNKAGDRGLTLERLSEMFDEGELTELPVIIKADVQGSLEAVDKALEGIGGTEIKVKIIHKGVGGVSENDVQLALASKAIIAAFNVRADSRAIAVADAEGAEIIYSRIIYELADIIKQIAQGRLAPQFKEKSLGRVEVRQVFKVPKIGTVAGSYVVDGTVQRGSLVRLVRDNKVVYEGKMASLRRFKDDVKEVQAGYECGIGIEGYSDIKDGDIIEVYKLEEFRPTLN